DENDAVLFAKACERAAIPVVLRRVADGEEARDYLLGEGIFTNRAEHPFPQVIVLDLKLPGMNGFEFLAWLRSVKEWGAIPVLIFTSSLSREDKARAMAAGADSFFVKPASFEALVQMVEMFKMTDRPNWN
ncbi:MAG TPA: response regulator, partial [Verrucomicrobiae bacterium]|nr:response regulator [Verrucomicrobiae bacterium]